MPLIQSAKKRAIQDKKKTERNRSEKSRMLSLTKNIIKWVHNGEVAKAEGFLAETQKAIDTAAKKNIICKNNAARKKSRIARVLSEAQKKAPSAS